MIGRPTNFLGLAFGDRGIACAEIAANGDRRTVRRIATFAFTPDHTLEKPEVAGAALAAFLREKKFTASRVVAGVPARWLIASEKDIPPANEAQAVAALQLQAERISADGEIVFDFAGKPNPGAPSRVLLVGIARPQFDKVQRLLDSAGLSVGAITSTGLALAGSLKQGDESAAVLVIGASGAEVVLRQAGGARALRHVALSANGHGMPALAPLGAELRRAVAMSGANGATREMFLLDGIGLGAEQIAELSTRSGLTMRGGEELKLLGLPADAVALAQSPGEESAPVRTFAPAIALALCAPKPDALSLDFSHSRLTLAKKRRIGRHAIIGIVLGALVLSYIIALWVQVNHRQNDLDAVKTQLKDMDERVKTAQLVVDRVTYAKGFYEARPQVLECLRQITAAFRDDEKIWVTSFKISEPGKGETVGKGQLVGKAADQETALKLIDRLKANSKLSDVGKQMDLHEADPRTREWAFTLNFNYKFGE